MLAVIMSFVQPDMTFTPGSFAGTGLQYLDVYYSTVQSEIATLKAKGGTCLGCTTATYRVGSLHWSCVLAAGTTVLVAVGGASYTNWYAVHLITSAIYQPGQV